MMISTGWFIANVTCKYLVTPVRRVHAGVRGVGPGGQCQGWCGLGPRDPVNPPPRVLRPIKTRVRSVSSQGKIPKATHTLVLLFLMAISKAWISLLLALAVVLSAPAARAEEAPAAEEEAPAAEAVLTLDADGFDEAVAKHPFMVVEFYAPWWVCSALLCYGPPVDELCVLG